MTNLKTKLKNLSAENHDQKSKLDAAQHELAEFEQLTGRYNALVAQAEDLHAENEKARGKIDNLRARVTRAESGEQESNQQLETLQHELRQIKTDLNQFSRENNELKTENASLQSALGDAQKNIEKAARLNKKLQQGHDESQATLGALRNSLAEAKTQVEDLKDSIDELTRRKNQAEESAKDSEIRLIKFTSERKEMVAALQTEIDSLKAGSEELEKEVYQLRAQSTEQERKLFLEEENRKKAEMESRQLTRQVSQLTVKVAELEQMKAKMGAGNQTNRRLTEDLSEARRNNDFLIAQLHRLESKDSQSGSFFVDEQNRTRESNDNYGFSDQVGRQQRGRSPARERRGK
jgi:chromosome segregation ATPase